MYEWEECEECDGMGYVRDLFMKSGPDGPIESYTEEDCPECEGTGEANTEDEKGEI